MPAQNQVYMGSNRTFHEISPYNKAFTRTAHFLRTNGLIVVLSALRPDRQ
jgi:hypothetical protein